MSKIIRQAMAETAKAVPDKTALISLVRRAHELGQSTGAMDRVREGVNVSESSAKTYAAICGRRLDFDQDGGGQLLEGVSAASYHATRAALRWGAARAWYEARRAADKAQKAGDISTAEVWAKRAVVAGEVLQSIETAKRPEATKRRKSKRAVLPKGDDWQARVYDAATPTQRPAVAVLWATGCRPIELENGVDISRNKAGALVVRIPGAKVSEKMGSGQPVRALVIDESTPAGQALAAVLGSEKQITVQRVADRLNKDFAAIRAKIGGKMSPYSMRHQVGANLKAELGPDGADKVAEALGHRTTKSQSRYGSVSQAQSGGAGILRTAATHKIKETRSGPRPSTSKNPSPQTGPRS